MKLEVRLFGGLVDRMGASRLSVELDDDATVADLRTHLSRAHPSAAGLLERCSVAVDLEVAGPGEPLAPDREVAVLPPVAGGQTVSLVGLRPPPLPVEEALRVVAAPGAGATVLFLGTVRDRSAHTEEVQRLEYRAYEVMAERVLEEIAGELLGTWPELTGVALLHAVGDLPVGAHTIAIVCSSPHRDEAYAASRHALEEVKRRVPIWKREVGTDGAHWVGLDSHPH